MVNKYSAFRCKSGYKSKGGVQGQNSPFTPVQFTTRIRAFKWTKANPREDVPSSHSLSTRALHTIVDVYALHCRRCKVMHSMQFGKTGGTYGARFQTTSTSLVRNNQLPIFFALVVVHKFTHEVRRIKVVVVLHPFDFVSERMVSNKRETIGSSALCF